MADGTSPAAVIKFNRYSVLFQALGTNSGEADLVFLGLSENQDLAEYMQMWSKLERDAIFVRSNGEADLSD